MLSPVPLNQQQIYQPHFKAGNSNNMRAMGERSVRSVEFIGRKFINRITDLFQRKNKEYYSDILQIDTFSPEYIAKTNQISREHANKNILNINLEDKRIEKIAQSGKPHIFIMNHDNQLKDPQMFAAFNTMLYDEYIKNGQSAVCPRSKIVLNEDILLSMSEKQRKFHEKLGEVPIDASIYDTDHEKNAKTFAKLIREFASGKANIFIFPEGKLSIFTNRPLIEKFQKGVATMVTKLTNYTDEVRVTPIGFAYGKKALAGEDSIYIGETVIFKKNGEHITSSRGNISSKFADKDYKNFFKDKEEAIITDNGVPVTGKEQSNYVAGILCENLNICKEEAKHALTHSDSNKPIIKY